MQAGFHVIGDAAADVVLDGLDAAAAVVGLAAVVAGRHRLEHAECLDAAQIARMARLGLVASVQPAFDAAWGGPDGMYVLRLGAERAARMNPYAALSAAGVALALSSDAPVTPIDPWGGVRAAVHHRTPGHGISARAAFARAHAGRLAGAGGDDLAGLLVPGAPAHYAVWEAGDLAVQQPDSRVAQWSTDPRSGVSGLPDLGPDAPTPVCLRTVLRRDDPVRPTGMTLPTGLHGPKRASFPAVSRRHAAGQNFLPSSVTGPMVRLTCGDDPKAAGHEGVDSPDGVTCSFPPVHFGTTTAEPPAAAPPLATRPGREGESPRGPGRGYQDQASVPTARGPPWPAGGGTRYGPGRPVDNGARLRSRRGVRRSEGPPGPPLDTPHPSRAPGSPRVRSPDPRRGDP